jgi:6-phospho-beta-glucosidase
VTEGAELLAVQAFASHPLVDSVTVARDLMASYHQALPDFYVGLR